MLEETPGYWEVPDRPARIRALDARVRDAAHALVAKEADLSRFQPEWARTLD